MILREGTKVGKPVKYLSSYGQKKKGYGKLQRNMTILIKAVAIGSCRGSNTYVIY